MQAKKSLGQHFLRCEWVADALIKAADIGPKDMVLEIGPGAGALTRPLAAASGHVIAVEKDERLATALKNALQKEGIGNVEVIPEDILPFLRFQTKSRIYSRLSLEKPYKIIANIPYYLTGRLLRLITDSAQKPHIIALTVQKEVAERIVAHPPRMNLLALAVQAYGKPEIIKIVPASCFSPKPKVNSAIIRISDISDDFFQKNNLDETVFFSIVRAAFGNKRKMLVNTLPTGGDKKEIAKKLAALGISSRARPEELSLKNWVDIVRLFS